MDTISRVYHLEMDLLTGRILYSHFSALRIIDGRTKSDLVGQSNRPGYSEGFFDAAKFNQIKGFTQINSSVIIISDERNHCLRWADRMTNTTSRYLGVCQASGFRGGVDPQFTRPLGLVFLKHTNSLILCENNGRVRSINMSTKNATVIYSTRSPTTLTLDFTGKHVLIGNLANVELLILQDGDLTNVSRYAGKDTPRNYKDGSLAEAEFGYVRGISPVSRHITLVIDHYNEKLRIINSMLRVVDTVCFQVEHANGSVIERCSFEGPYGLCFANGSLYIGESYKIVKAEGQSG